MNFIWIVWSTLYVYLWRARACQSRKQQNGSLWMSLQVHLCNQQWIIERLMMQITLLSLQFLLIIPTIEGRELFRISDDGLGGFRARNFCPHETFIEKHVCTICSSMQDVEKIAIRVSTFLFYISAKGDFFFRKCN